MEASDILDTYLVLSWNMAFSSNEYDKQIYRVACSVCVDGCRCVGAEASFAELLNEQNTRYWMWWGVWGLEASCILNT